MRWIKLATLALATGLAVAAEEQRGEPFFTPTSVPAHAVEIADAHLKMLVEAGKLTPADLSYQRFIWVSTGVREDVQAVAAAVQYASRASVVVRPTPVDEKGYLLRVDLRWYAPRTKDIEEWLEAWESLRFDPKFSLIITRDTLDLLGAQVAEFEGKPVKVRVKRKERVTVAPYVWKDGKTYDWEERERWVLEERKFSTKDLKDVEAIRFNSPAIDPVLYGQLQLSLQTEAPVVSHTYLLFRMLSAVKRTAAGQKAEPYETIYGGLYYEFAGIKKSQVKGVSDEDLLFEAVGIGSVQRRHDAQFDQLRSDRRGVLLRSGVTGKPRIWEIYPTLKRLGGILGRTRDIFDTDIDLLSRAPAYLLNPRDRARETIYGGANGFNKFVLFNNEGELQDEVPADVAADTTIPAPHTKRLQPAIGCIRCHGGDGSDGWKPLGSDIRAILGNRLDIIGDVSARTRLTADVNDRLAGLYGGSADAALRIARDDHAEAHLRATGPWRDDPTQKDTVKMVSQRIGGTYERYWYDLVTPRQFLVELGFDVPREVEGPPAPGKQATDKPAIAFLNTLLPPDPASAIGDFVPEDWRLAALKAGKGIPRSDADLAYVYAAGRALRELKGLEQRIKQVHEQVKTKEVQK